MFIYTFAEMAYSPTLENIVHIALSFSDVSSNLPEAGCPTRELTVQRDLNTTDNIILHATRTGSRLPPGGLSRVRNPGMSVVFADRLLA